MKKSSTLVHTIYFSPVNFRKHLNIWIIFNI
jgi:hypothetical protein